MLLILIDAAILLGLLSSLGGEEIEFLVSLVVAFVTAIGVYALTLAMLTLMGAQGLFVASLLAVALLGAAISWLWGVEIKRSMLIAFLFLVIHNTIVFGISMLYQNALGG